MQKRLLPFPKRPVSKVVFATCVQHGLQDLVFVHEECGLCGEPHRTVPIYLHHFGNLRKEGGKISGERLLCAGKDQVDQWSDKVPMTTEGEEAGTHLDVAVVLLGDKGDVYREKVTGLPSNAEFQTAALIFSIDHRQAPFQGVPSTVMAIVTINLSNHRRSYTRPEEAATGYHWTPHTTPHARANEQQTESEGITHGKGMVITTSFSSRLSSCSSYSMLTSHPFPLSEGQQLTEATRQQPCSQSHSKGLPWRNTEEPKHIRRTCYDGSSPRQGGNLPTWFSCNCRSHAFHSLVNGMKDSSVVCSRHFKTPTSLFMGKDFSGFFRPIRESAVKSFLSTLG